jgi:hypothetical protein
MKKTHALFAFVSLIVLLTAGAAQSLSGTNTVDSGDIIDGQVKFADIKPDAVTSSRIRTDAVGASEIRADQVGASELADNSVASANVIDGTLTSSDLGTDSVFNSELGDNSVFSSNIFPGQVRGSDLGTITERSAVSGAVTPGNHGFASVQCLAGEQVLSGGNDGFFEGRVIASRKEGPNGWGVHVQNEGGGNITITVHAYCLAA